MWPKSFATDKRLFVYFSLYEGVWVNWVVCSKSVRSPPFMRPFYTCQLFLRYEREILIFEDDMIISEDSRRGPKSSAKTSEVCQRRSFHLLFTSKIREREEGIVIYSFYTWFSFLTWVWVNIFLEIVSSKSATTHMFQSDVRNWPASMSQCEIEVFNPQAWDSRLRRESWQVYLSDLF